MSVLVCTEATRVREAVQKLHSEEVSSSSSLPPSLAPELKRHLTACASCAAEAVALEPTLVFTPLAASVSPEAPARGIRRPVADDARLVADAVLEEVRRRARVSSPAAPERRPLVSRRFAQVAALLALTAGLAGLVRWERTRPALEAVRTPEAAAPAAVEAGASARPLIEGVRNPNARVYEFAAASSQEPTVVFVANPNADL